MLNNSKNSNTFVALSEQFCTAEKSSVPQGWSTPPLGLSFIDCSECEGTGKIEIFIDCGKPASECCGGCTKTIECETCKGDGQCQQKS
jgi:hypothetical protein